MSRLQRPVCIVEASIHTLCKGDKHVRVQESTKDTKVTNECWCRCYLVLQCSTPRPATCFFWDAHCWPRRSALPSMPALCEAWFPSSICLGRKRYPYSELCSCVLRTVVACFSFDVLLADSEEIDEKQAPGRDTSADRYSHFLTKSNPG